MRETAEALAADTEATLGSSQHPTAPPGLEGPGSTLPCLPVTLAFTEVGYTVSTKDGDKKLLDGVSGWCKPGTMTALMGVTGACRRLEQQHAAHVACHAHVGALTR